MILFLKIYLSNLLDIFLAPDSLRVILMGAIVFALMYVTFFMDKRASDVLSQHGINDRE